MKVIALDFGAARTGVAVSDATGHARTSRGRRREAPRATRGSTASSRVVGEHEAELVLVGLPLTLRGERGEQARATEAFVDALRARLVDPGRDLRRAVHDDARRSRPAAGRRRTPSRPRTCCRAGWSAPVTRWLALVAAVGVVAVGAFAVTAWVAGGDEDDPPAPTTRRRQPLARLRIIFPEGFAVAEMADRVAAVRHIAIAKRGVTPRLTSAGYLRAVEAARAPARFRKDMKRDSMEGFLFPALYEFTQEHDRARARRRPASCVPRSASGPWTSPTRARRT